jgi:hypothetical protein
MGFGSFGDNGMMAIGLMAGLWRAAIKIRLGR